MPIDDLQQAAQKIAGFLANLNKLGGLRLKFRISAGAAGAAGAGAEPSALNVELAGPDVPLVTQHNGELLRALEGEETVRLELGGPDGAALFAVDGYRHVLMPLAAVPEPVFRPGPGPDAFPPPCNATSPSTPTRWQAPPRR